MTSFPCRDRKNQLDGTLFLKTHCCMNFLIGMLQVASMVFDHIHQNISGSVQWFLRTAKITWITKMGHRKLSLFLRGVTLYFNWTSGTETEVNMEVRLSLGSMRSVLFVRKKVARKVAKSVWRRGETGSGACQWWAGERRTVLVKKTKTLCCFPVYMVPISYTPDPTPVVQWLFLDVIQEEKFGQAWKIQHFMLLKNDRKIKTAKSKFSSQHRRASPFHTRFNSSKQLCFVFVWFSWLGSVLSE